MLKTISVFSHNKIQPSSADVPIYFDVMYLTSET